MSTFQLLLIIALKVKKKINVILLSDGIERLKMVTGKTVTSFCADLCNKDEVDQVFTKVSQMLDVINVVGWDRLWLNTILNNIVIHHHQFTY